jgi:hypothetical protein
MANWQGEENGSAFIITASILATEKRRNVSDITPALQSSCVVFSFSKHEAFINSDIFPTFKVKHCQHCEK